MAELQDDVYLSIGITWFAALVALCLRLIARRITRNKSWFDDYLSVLAFLFATGYCAILIEWTLHWSLGKHIPDSIDDLAREKILYQARKLSFFNSLCYAASLACSKMSILLFYWRLFKFSFIRLPIVFLLVISAMWFILRTFMLSFRCIPTRAIWDKTIPDAVCNIDSNKFFLATITTHFTLDVMILVLPIVPILSLHLPLQERLGVVVFFLLGAIVCVASCIVLVILIRFPDDTQQLPYDYATFCIWGAVEVNIAVVSGCCPLLRPVIRCVCPGLFPSAVASSKHNTESRSAMRLNTLRSTRKRSNDDATSSTHNLADTELDTFDGQALLEEVYTISSSNKVHKRSEPRQVT